MANRAWLRWNSFTAEDRAVLAQLYQYAIRCPQFVSEYKLEFHRLGPTVQQIEIHRFRFGVANFVIVTTQTTEIMLDLWLDDDYEIVIAAE